MASATTLVHWLGSGEAPAQLVAHLKTRGFALGPVNESEVMSPVRLSSVGASVSSLGQSPLIGRRVAVLYPDPGAADTLAQSLRARGATVTVLSLNPAALERVAGLDPDVVLVEPADFMGGCWEIVRALWAHPRLRWATVILTAADPLGLFALSAPDCDRLCQTIQQHSENYEELLKRAASGTPFSGWLATLGPARTLRAVAASGARLRLLFESSAHSIEVDVAEHLVTGAREVEAQHPDEALFGAEALARLLSMDQAKLSVQKAESPPLANVMAPLDDALLAARRFSTAPPAPAHAEALVPRRELRPANSDSIATVRPPAPPVPSSQGLPQVSVKGTGSGRVYPFPTVMPLPPVPRKASIPAVPQAISALRAQTVDQVGPAVSAAALNLSVESIAFAAPSLRPDSRSDAVREGLHSGIVEAMPQLLDKAWAPADDPLVEPYDAEERPPPDQERPRVQWSTVATAVEQRIARPKEWARRASQRVNETPLRVMLVSALAVFCVCLLVRAYVTTTNTDAAANAGSALRIRVRKLSPETQNTNQAESSDQAIEAAVDASKPPGRRASELVSLGHALRREGKPERAENMYRAALKALPGYPRALTGLTRLALERGQGASAVRFAQALVRATPKQGASHLLLGDAHRAAGNLAAATNAWKAAAKRGDRVAKSRLKVSSARSVSSKATN